MDAGICGLPDEPNSPIKGYAMAEGSDLPDTAKPGVVLTDSTFGCKLHLAAEV